MCSNLESCRLQFQNHKIWNQFTIVHTEAERPILLANKHHGRGQAYAWTAAFFDDAIIQQLVNMALHLLSTDVGVGDGVAA